MSVGIDRRHGDEDIHRIVISWLNSSGFFSVTSAKPVFLTPLPGDRAALPGRVRAQSTDLLFNRIQNRLVVTRLDNIRRTSRSTPIFTASCHVSASACSGWIYSPPANHVISWRVLTSLLRKMLFDHFQQFRAKVGRRSILRTPTTYLLPVTVISPAIG